MYGWSDYSPITKFTAADLPSQPLKPAIQFASASRIDLLFDLETIDDGGIEIQSYLLEFAEYKIEQYQMVEGYQG